MARTKKSGRKYSPKASQSVEREMKAMKEGKLRSGRSGKKVTNPKQAIAIGLSEARKKGAKTPPPPGRSSAKKKAAKKTAGRKTASKRTSAKKSSARKTTRPRKTAAKRTAAKKRTARR